MNEKQNADYSAVYGAIRWVMEEHHTRTTCMASTRLFSVVSMLVNQPTARISEPEAGNKDLLAKADLLFAYMSPKI